MQTGRNFKNTNYFFVSGKSKYKGISRGNWWEVTDGK
jgi:hypothetical protein